MNRQQIYLDNNSTTVIDPAVAQAMFDCLSTGYVNPASQHQSGQAARRRLEKIRTELLSMLGAVTSGMTADELIFTSGGTESNNLALIGLAHEPDGSVPDKKRILISAIEHPSIVAAGEYLSRRGFIVESIAVNEDGMVCLSDLAARLNFPARLVSVMLANNETGVLQPIRAIAELCRSHGALLHTDAVQAVGKIAVDFGDLSVDALTFTAHKLHGPRGIGGLILKHGLRPFPNLFGGFQQRGFRPGTEDVCLATGFLECVRQYRASNGERESRMRALRDQLQQSICEQCSDVVVNGGRATRVPHTLNLSFRGLNRQEILLAADMAGLAVSTGSACASGSSDLSPVLLAMGLDSDVIESSIRFSLSALTTAADIEAAINTIVRISRELLARK